MCTAHAVVTVAASTAMSAGAVQAAVAAAVATLRIGRREVLDGTTYWVKER